MDVSLRKFLGDVVYAIMLVAVIIAALDAVGVKTTAVVAVLGAAGLAIGLALQGSLSNFAAGVMLIVLRPYKVGDLVDVGKYLGRVDAIRVFQTIIITADNREVTIPNGQIIAQPIENLTVLGRRRVDLVVTVAQATDLAQVRSLLESVVQRQAHPAVAAARDRDRRDHRRLREASPAAVGIDGRLHRASTTDMMERIKTTMEAAAAQVLGPAPGGAVMNKSPRRGRRDQCRALRRRRRVRRPRLRQRLEPRALEIFETGARYHMYHALAMILCAVIATSGSRTAGWIFQAGIVIFCGSLYALALTDVKILGAITPIGGLAFLAGWILSRVQRAR